MKLCHINIQGLSTSYDSLCEVLTTNPQLDIITLSETHICTDLYDNLYHIIPGYIFIKRNRSKGKGGGGGGGVGMYIKNGLNWKRRTDLELKELENIWIEVFINKSKNLLICSLYRPPIGSRYLSKNFLETFRQKIIVMCDLNINF